MFQDRNGTTFSFDVCSRCFRNCCKDANPPLTINRMKILANFAKSQNISTDGLFVCEKYFHPKVDENGVCFFYDANSQKCRVHSVKPETCRAGPVTFDINLKTRKIEFYLKKFEVCLFAQVLYGADECFKEHLEVAKEEIKQLICELDPFALEAILKIPEPETFKVAEDDLPKEVIAKLDEISKRC